jgi:hypothetical protein
MSRVRDEEEHSVLMKDYPSLVSAPRCFAVNIASARKEEAAQT